MYDTKIELCPICQTKTIHLTQNTGCGSSHKCQECGNQRTDDQKENINA